MKATQFIKLKILKDDIESKLIREIDSQPIQL